MQRHTDFGYNEATPVDRLMCDTRMGLAIGFAALDGYPDKDDIETFDGFQIGELPGRIDVV